LKRNETWENKLRESRTREEYGKGSGVSKGSNMRIGMIGNGISRST
jgi:hypothetical protein